MPATHKPCGNRFLSGVVSFDFQAGTIPSEFSDMANSLTHLQTLA